MPTAKVNFRCQRRLQKQIVGVKDGFWRGENHNVINNSNRFASGYPTFMGLSLQTQIR